MTLTLTLYPHGAAGVKDLQAGSHTGFAGAPSHIDDKWGVDVDDVYEINDILPAADRSQFTLSIEPATTTATDPLELGYITFDKLAGH